MKKKIFKKIFVLIMLLLSTIFCFLQNPDLKFISDSEIERNGCFTKVFKRRSKHNKSLFKITESGKKLNKHSEYNGELRCTAVGKVITCPVSKVNYLEGKGPTVTDKIEVTYNTTKVVKILSILSDATYQLVLFPINETEDAQDDSFYASDEFSYDSANKVFKKIETKPRMQKNGAE